MSYKYKAFGFVVESYCPILQLQPADIAAEADIQIKEAKLPELASLPAYRERVTDNIIEFNFPVAGFFRISNGNLIEADLNDACTHEMASLYFMGSCMGAILHERQLLPLHGSCVTNGKQSVLISGDSGAGKSTLASEFINNGWKLVTDDVSLIRDFDKEQPLVQSSYPSQKMWKDTMDRYKVQILDIHSLYTRGEREKFGVSAAAYFYEGTAPLSLFVQLFAHDEDQLIQPIEGIEVLDRIVKNTYRAHFITDKNRNAYFQKCVALSQHLPIAMVVRRRNEESASTLYKMITEYLDTISK